MFVSYPHTFSQGVPTLAHIELLSLLYPLAVSDFFFSVVFLSSHLPDGNADDERNHCDDAGQEKTELLVLPPHATLELLGTLLES